MGRRADPRSLRWLLRHPLVATVALLALTILLPVLRIGERLKLMALLPVAWAAGDDVPQVDPADLDEEERLRIELQRAVETNTRLVDERDALREMLAQCRNVADDAEHPFYEVSLPQTVPARVIMQGDASGWRHCCVINRGSAHGVEEQMPVVSGRTLVGRVFLVAEDHALVQLVTDPGFSAGCIVLDPEEPPENPEDRIRGVIRGDGSVQPHFPKLALEDVANGAPVREGMLVATNDFGGQFPLGLSVGTVREVIPRAGYVEVRVDAGFEADELRVVQVLLHGRPEIEDQALELIRRR